jgi:L,D-transpeptidase ErfK/SrfK
MPIRPTLTLALLGLIAAPALAREFVLVADSDVIGEVEVTRSVFEDTYFEIGRKYNVGLEELQWANPGVDYVIPGEGTEIVIPSRFVLPDAPRRGIVVNVPEYRIYYYPDGDSGRVFTFPISIGKEGWTTPYGATTVVRKTHLPIWYPPASVRAEHEAAGDPLPAVVPPGPDNPLGEHALYLGFASYLIHGTNQPRGLGMRASHGCIRMYPEDVALLFSMVEPGTPVRIVNQPYKLGWGEGGLYIEAHPPLAEETEQWTLSELARIYVGATTERRAELLWDEAEAVLAAARGIPAFVSVEGTITLADLDEDEDAGERP